jgi:hypothetical protein
MSHCPNQTDWVLYAAKELPSEELRRLQEHLEACPDCRREARMLERGLSALSVLDREAPMPAEAAEALRRRLRVATVHPSARPSIILTLWKWRWSSAAVAVLAAALIWSLQPGPTVNITPKPAVEIVKTLTPKMPVQATPQYRTDALIQEELAELSASVELLETSEVTKTPDAPAVQPKPSDNSDNDMDDFIQYFESEMNT